MDLKDVEIRAETLLATYGLYQQGWRMKFDNAKRRLGQCRYKKLEIGISKEYAELNDEARINNTILHEIAHALVGSKNGHNHKWKLKAIEIGCDGQARCTAPINQPTPAYTATCQNCGQTHARHRKARRAIACRPCCDNYNGGRFSALYILEYKK